MSHVLLTNQNPDFRPDFTPRSRRSGGFSFNLNVGPVTAMITMMVLIGLMGLLSLTYLNAQSTKGYMINKLEDDHQELVSDREINDMLILQARSMQNIESHPQVMAMVRPAGVTFFEPVSGIATAN